MVTAERSGAGAGGEGGACLEDRSDDREREREDSRRGGVTFKQHTAQVGSFHTIIENYTHTHARDWSCPWY